jgi:hypothetical protein
MPVKHDRDMFHMDHGLRTFDDLRFRYDQFWWTSNFFFCVLSVPLVSSVVEG